MAREERATQETWRLMGRTPMTAMEETYLSYNSEATARSFETTGSPIAMGRRKAIDGWLYVSLPEAPADLTERQARHQARVRSWLDGRTSIYEAEIRPVLEERLAEVRGLVAGDGPAHAARIRAAMDLAAFAHGEVHWWMNLLEPFDWPATYARVTGRPAEEANVLLRGMETAASELVERLAATGRVLRDEGEESGAFAAAFAALLDRFGARSGTGYGSMVGFSDPTWELDPERALRVLRAYARADLEARDADQRRGAEERDRLLEEVRSSLAGHAERLDEFESAYWVAQANVASQEDSNDLIEQRIIGTMKRVIVEAGRWAQQAGLLAEVDDVWHLTPDDIEGGGDLRAVAAERRAEHERRRETTPPAVIGDPSAPAPAFFGRGGDAPAPQADGVLRGEAIYPGTVTGRARVVGPGLDPPELDDGEILVVADTGPAWTPVFPLLAAVVLDHGAAFQHAAIMAREFGIPCVIGTRSATKVIPDGATITVDGAAGTVTVHDR